MFEEVKYLFNLTLEKVIFVDVTVAKVASLFKKKAIMCQWMVIAPYQPKLKVIIL